MKAGMDQKSVSSHSRPPLKCLFLRGAVLNFAKVGFLPDLRGNRPERIHAKGFPSHSRLPGGPGHHLVARFCKCRVWCPLQTDRAQQGYRNPPDCSLDWHMDHASTALRAFAQPNET